MVFAEPWISAAAGKDDGMMAFRFDSIAAERTHGAQEGVCAVVYFAGAAQWRRRFAARP